MSEVLFHQIMQIGGLLLLILCVAVAGLIGWSIFLAIRNWKL